MALRPIVQYPNPVLTTPAREVAEVDDTVRALVDDMVETMYAARGIGLAAPQIGEPLRIAVIDIAGDDEEEEEAGEERKRGPRPSSEPDLRVLINPRIVERSGTIIWNEGCLSMPGLYREVKRAAEVTVEALDRDGNLQRHTATELLAVCMQHEIDHLDGVMFIDRLSPLKKRMALKEWKRRVERRAADEEKSEESPRA